jgi:hypothetical protein
MITGIVLVKELVRPSLNPGNRNLDPGGKGIFDDLAGGQAFELGADKSRTFAGFYMLELNDGVKTIVVFNAKTISEICGSSHKKEMNVLPKIVKPSIFQA